MYCSRQWWYGAGMTAHMLEILKSSFYTGGVKAFLHLILQLHLLGN